MTQDPGQDPTQTRTQDPTDRRDLLNLAGALALGAAAPVAAAAAPLPPGAPPEPGPAMTGPSPKTRTPGRPGDFGFLDGRWHIRHLRPRADGGWDAFEGEAQCFSILQGLGSVEELSIPARGFSGLGLRLLDVKQRLWMDHWVNANSGVMTAPGLPGSFEAGAGLFESEDEESGQKVLYRSVWDRIGPQGCRWQQGSSRDGGRTWALSWDMIWSRRS